jgi:hypothetical protein
MRLPRMTTRRWMVVVAIVALAFEGIRVKRWHDYCLDRAAGHAMLESEGLRGEGVHRRYLDYDEQHYPRTAGEADPWEKWRRREESQARSNHRFAEHHARMGRKYGHAAWRPWESVPLDPPLPSWP